jgi:DNA helicase-2/ATP-dependent DNA helicase PcrA
MAKGDEVKVKTFHSFCFELLHNHHNLLGFETLSIMDRHDTKLVVEGILQRMEQDVVDEASLPSATKILQTIRQAKSEMLQPPDLEAAGKTSALLVRAYSEYESEKQQRGMLDLTDFAWLTLYLLSAHPNVLFDVRSHFCSGHLFVDEAQDLDRAQFALLRLLAGLPEAEATTAAKKNIPCPSTPLGGVTICGDDDQAIFGWRGGSVDGTSYQPACSRRAFILRITDSKPVRSFPNLPDASECDHVPS